MWMVASPDGSVGLGSGDGGCGGEIGCAGLGDGAALFGLSIAPPPYYIFLRESIGC